MKPIFASILFAIVLIVGSSILAKNKGVTPPPSSENNVSIVGGKQIVNLVAKGGYQPNRSVAKANIPTIIRFETSGTFDCSASVRIPSMNISEYLKPTGTTDIDIGSQLVSTFTGSCGMGMYPFEIVFE